MTTRTQQIEQLLESFQAIRRKLEAKGAFPAHEAHCRITPAQWRVLRIIGQKKCVMIKDIALQLEMSSSAATQLVDGLVENGHLKRCTNPVDRRSLYVEYSDATREKMHQMRTTYIKHLSERFSALSDGELQDYLRLSIKVAEHTASHSA